MARVEKSGKKWRGIARKTINKTAFKKTKTFATRKEAMTWAVEVEKDLGTEEPEEHINDITFKSLIKRYLIEVSPTKKSAKSEVLRLNRFLRNYPRIAKKPISKLTARDIVLWKEDRLKSVMPSTVSREWNNLSAVITSAQKDWGLPIPSNPFSQTRRPESGKPRRQRIAPDDVDALLTAFDYDPSDKPTTARALSIWALLFAIETAMRCSEICRLNQNDISGNIAHLRETKNGEDRYVPLSTEALRLLSLVELPIDTNPSKIDANFRKYRPDELRHINFHDSRHEALTRMSDKISNPMTLAKISGHKDINILLNVYYNPKGDDLSSLLD